MSTNKAIHALYNDDDISVFLDKYPIDQGHSLVASKKHYEKITDMKPDEVGSMFSKIPKIANAILSGTGADAFSIAQNNGRAAKQIIPHVHVHIIPRFNHKGTIWTKREISNNDELEALAEKIELETKQENARLRRLKSEVNWISSSPKARQSKSKARINNYETLLNKENIQSIDDPQIIIPNAPRLGDLVIELNNLKKVIEDKVLFEDLSFKVPKGAIVGIIGANGAGKTTLFNIISDKLDATDGLVRLGETVNLSYVDQSRETLDSVKTVWEEISEGNDIVEINSTTINTRAYTSAFNFKGSDQQKKVGQLSGGERNRVHLAKVLKSGANVLLLDEPTNDLDVETLYALEYALDKFSGCAMIISHDRWFLDRVCTHILAFEGNSNVEWFEGSYSEYSEDRKRRLGDEGEIPSRIKYKKFSR